ncbi:28S ribosomal protein S9, mitochondrial-like [Dreissena polymorpha]|uniref:Mitochondrial ribosomal protein S9 n=1 Tax=Dreissena polymorpha TaxID=45954 RepID=A0A9D4D6D4_DREPO|nr:28S ribosomal protein S9, mitochondrial-like [Dreissena polymorpha]KAH3739858.1 hypothetical protein DPMN_046548 [Dreissena polymorpha]
MSFTTLRLYRHLNLLQFATSESTYNRRALFHQSHCCQQNKNVPAQGRDGLVGSETSTVPKAFSRTQMITRSMERFIKHLQGEELKRQRDIAEYELGKRHLANMMGLDEGQEMTQEDVKKCIEYLFPSGLFNKQARPMMEHPLVLRPRVQIAEHDEEGRPKHYLHYTMKPTFYELLHKAAVKYERLKGFDGGQEGNLSVNTTASEEIEFEMLEWIPYAEFKDLFKPEKISEADYKRFLTLFSRLREHPLGHMECDFVKTFLRVRQAADSGEKKKLLPIKDEDGRLFVIERGFKKTAKAYVSLKNNGSGQWNINGKDLTYFEDVLYRQVVMWPLQLCNVIDRYDVSVRVTGSGISGQAQAIRLGVSRCLSAFMSQELVEKMRIAGLLTRDPRRRERKKPGQEKARKPFTWLRR